MYGPGDGGGEKLARLFADFERGAARDRHRGGVRALAGVGRHAHGAGHAKAVRTSAEMDAFLERVIADHRQRRRDGGQREGDHDHRDFVDMLLDLNDDAE